MAWTYVVGSSAADKDKVRLLIGDTDETDQQLQDEEIADFLTDAPDVYRAASYAADAIAAKYTRQADKYMGSRVRIQASQRAAAYQRLAKRLLKRAGVRASITVGGTSLSEKQTLDSNPDAVQPMVTRHQDDFPENLSSMDIVMDGTQTLDEV